jgi:GTP cyclohydrolase IA
MRIPGMIPEDEEEDQLRPIRGWRGWSTDAGGIGGGTGSPGLIKTPDRVARSLEFLTSGAREDLGRLVNGAIFAEECNEMVVVKHIHFFSLCEHHMLPFFGVCSVAYVPNGHIIGLSKIPRIVDMYARRLQVQERLTNEIAVALDSVLSPAGVGVVMEAYHLCMMMRGVQKQDSRTVTSAMHGVFKDDSEDAAGIPDADGLVGDGRVNGDPDYFSGSLISA